MGLGNLSIKVSADIGQFKTNLDLAGKAAQENMAASALSVDTFRRGMVQTSEDTAVAAQKMSNSMAAANDAIMNSATSAADSIQNIADTADNTDFRPLGEKIAEAIGTGIGVGIVAANKAWDGFAAYSKTKALVIAAAVSVAFAAVGLGAIYTAYKVISGSMDFIVGLITGDSYKSANIDALITANDQVKEIQKSLSLTAQQAAATNEALAALDVDKGDYLSVFNKANEAIRSNTDSLDELGLKYGNVDELIQSANEKLNQYTEGWDRNQAAAAMGLGTAEQVAQAAKMSSSAISEANARLGEYNLGIGTDAQESVQRYTDTMREFNHNMDLTSQGFKRAIADNIMPVLTDLADFFKDGFPSAVNVFRYTMATVTSLFYGLKTSVFIVTEAIVGALSSVGSILGGVVSATAKALAGDFSGAKDALVQGWEASGIRLNDIGKNIVTQAQGNANAMRKAWALDDRASAGASAAKGQSYIDPEIEKKIKAQADAYQKMANAITEKTNAQQYEIQLNDKMTEGQRKLVEFTSALADGTLKLTDAQKADYLQRLEGLIAQEKINKKMEDARKDAAKNTKDVLTDYQKLTQSINDKIATSSADVISTGKVTEAEKLRAKYLTDLRDKVISMNAAERAAYETRLRVLDTLEKSKQAKEDMQRIFDAARQEEESSIASAQKEAEANKTLAETFGMSRSEIAKLELARLEERMSQRAAIGLTLDEIDALEKLIDAKRSSVESLGIVDIKQAAADAKKKVEEEAKAYEVAYDASNKKIGDGLYEALSRSGDAGLKKLLKDAKEWFARLVLSPIISPVAAFGASLMNPMAASAQGTMGGAIGSGSALNMISAGKSLWEGFSTGFAGLSSGIGGAIANIGGFLGSSSMTAFGAGMVAPGAAAGTTMTAAEIYGSMGMTSSATAASLGSTVAAAIPYVAAAVAAYYLGKAAFGMGDKEITGSNVSGTIGTDNLSRNVNWSQQGGWLRSDRSGTWSYGLSNSTAIADGVAYQDTANKGSDQAMLKALNEGYASLKQSSADYAAALGIDATSIATRTDSITVAIGKDATEMQNNISKLFSDLSNKIAGDLLGPFSKLALAGESASGTLTRLAEEAKSVDAAVNNMGLKFSASGSNGSSGNSSAVDNVQVASAKDQLVQLSGGLQAFSNSASYFAQNFLTQAEQIKPLADGVSKALAGLGVSNVATIEQFKNLVRGLDLSTEAGAKEFAALMALAPAFKQVADYTTSMNAGIQQQIDTIKLSMLTTQEQRDAELVGVDASTAALIRNRNALADQKVALDAATAAAQALASTNASIQQQITSLQDAALTKDQLRQKQLATAADDSTKALYLQLFAEQDKAEAAKAMAAAEAAAQQAAQQASQQAAQAAKQLASAWQSVTDSILNEVTRLRGASAVNSADAYAAAQAKFAIASAQAQAGDMNAAKLLPQLSQTLDTLAAQNASSAQELARIRAMTANSLEDTALTFQKFGATIPSSASGSDSSGGARLVGTSGPGLDVTGSTPIYKASQTASMLSGGGDDVVAELQALLAELHGFRVDSRAQGDAIAMNTDKTARVLARNDVGNGFLTTTQMPV